MACAPERGRSGPQSPAGGSDAAESGDAAADAADGEGEGEDVVVVPDGHRLSVSVTGDGEGRVVSEPAGIDCPGDCEEYFAEGVEVTLRPEAGAGSRFDRWAGACVGLGEVVRLAIAGGGHCTAFFVPE